METITEKDQKTIVIELADAIASFNIDKVAELLSEKGEYCIQDDKDEIIVSKKANFITWLGNCFDEYVFVNDGKTKLNYKLDQCLHCRIGNPVIILEKGKFPVFMKNSWEKEKCGLMLEFEDNLISGITFCFVFLHTDNPFQFELTCRRKYDKMSE
jgi:hypothetical protein